jgi:perosamine synthetase
MQAAIGISQLHKLPKIIDRKQKIHDRYCNELQNLEELSAVYLDDRSTPVWWFTSFLTEKKSELKAYLLDSGIQTRDFFYPLHMQPCYEYMSNDRDFSLSEKIYKRGISLPSSYNLTNEEQSYIIESIFDFFSAHEKL